MNWNFKVHNSICSQKACVTYYNHSFHVYENYAVVPFLPAESKGEKVAWISKERKLICLSSNLNVTALLAYLSLFLHQLLCVFFSSLSEEAWEHHDQL